MRTTPSTLIAIAAILLAVTTGVGCSSASPTRQSNERVVIDTDRVAQVEKVARETGVDVTWINPPRKRAR